ncbi:MAG: protein kinase, partial [Phycisphaerae bacterium]
MDRTAQIEALAEDYLRNLAAGTARAVEEVIAAHPALMPELNEALAQMIRLHRARQAADQAEEPRDEIPPTASGDSLAAEEASLRARVADSGSRTVEDWIPGYRIHVPGARDSRLVGGQGSVYKAIQLTTNRRVAIKILNRHTDASARKRFEREIDLIRKFKHPHIVTIFDAGKTRLGQPYYVMELVEHALHMDDYVHGRDADGQVVR